LELVDSSFALTRSLKRKAVTAAKDNLPWQISSGFRLIVVIDLMVRGKLYRKEEDVERGRGGSIIKNRTRIERMRRMKDGSIRPNQWHQFHP
jgi:hypothetical protein